MELHAMGFASRPWCGPLVIALILALAGIAPPAASPLTAIAAVAGHPSRVHLRASNSRVRDNRPIDEVLDIEGVHRMVRRCRADLCTGTWFDGSQLSDFGINMTSFPQTSSEVPTLVTYAAIVSTAFAEPDFTGTVTMLPANGTNDRFRVAASNGAPLIAIADSATHALLRVEAPEGTLVADFIASHVGAMTLYTDRRYQTVVQISEPLAAPAGPLTTLAGESDIPIVSPIFPVVPCTVDGVHANCLIDTGMTPSGMTLDFSEKLGREPHGEIDMPALASYVTGVVDVAKITVGSATIAGLRTVVVPQTRGINFDVILGSDALAGMRVILDPEHRSVHIGATSPTATGTGIALHFEGGLPYVDATLSPSLGPQRLVLDTGDNGTLSIPFDAYRKDPTLFAKLRDAKTYGLSGSADAIVGQLPSAGIGALTLEHADIQAVRGTTAGHVGYAFAGRCGRLAIDYRQLRMDCLKL
jgi:hypothetical protein